MTEIHAEELGDWKAGASPQWTSPSDKAAPVVNTADASGRAAKTASARRTACDLRKKAAGQVRVSVWLDTRVVDVIAKLSKYWSFNDRSQAVDVAVRYLDQQTRRGLGKIDLNE